MTLRFSQILFQSAGTAVAVALVYIGYVSVLPSASEYWGIDAGKSAEVAAEEAFSRGDYRFLGARVRGQEGKEAEFVYAIFNCVNHPLGDGLPKEYARFADVEGIDAWSETSYIRDFADSYNFRLRTLLEEHTEARCSGYDVG